MNNSFDDIFADEYSSNKETYLGVNSTSMNSESEKNSNPDSPNQELFTFHLKAENMLDKTMDFLEYEDYEYEGDLLIRKSIRENAIFLKSSDNLEKLAFSFTFVFDSKIKEAEENFNTLKGIRLNLIV
jgi:uncharacterized Rmd1/YagE family protein